MDKVEVGLYNIFWIGRIKAKWSPLNNKWLAYRPRFASVSQVSLDGLQLVRSREERKTRPARGSKRIKMGSTCLETGKKHVHFGWYAGGLFGIQLGFGIPMDAFLVARIERLYWWPPGSVIIRLSSNVGAANVGLYEGGQRLCFVKILNFFFENLNFFLFFLIFFQVFTHPMLMCKWACKKIPFI